jgi:hypothetical protein
VILDALFSSGGRCGSAPKRSELSRCCRDEGEPDLSRSAAVGGLISAAHVGTSLKLKGFESNSFPPANPSEKDRRPLDELPTDDARLLRLPPRILNRLGLPVLLSASSSGWMRIELPGAQWFGPTFSGMGQGSWRMILSGSSTTGLWLNMLMAGFGGGFES